MNKAQISKQIGKIPADWKMESLNEISWFQEGPGLRKWQFKDEGIKVINITNMVNGVLDLSKTQRYISWEEFNSSYKHFECEVEDIVIASSGNSYCKHAIVREQDLPLVMNTSVIRFQPINDSSYDFLNQFLKSALFKKQIDFMITGGAQPNFGPIHLNLVKVPLPPLPEQQKIAEILSTVDEKIEAIDQRIVETQELKKGLMQQLLTKGIGHTKFKDSPLGEIPESWKVVDIMSVLTIGSGRDYKHLKEGEIPVYGTGGLMTYVDDYLYDGTSVGIGRKGTIDKPVFLTGKFWTVDTLFYTHSFKEVIPKFIYYIFLEINWKKHNEASGVPSLSKSTIEKIKITIPCLQEQT